MLFGFRVVAYAVVLGVAFHLFAIGYEEPTLHEPSERRLRRIQADGPAPVPRGASRRASAGELCLKFR